MDPDPPNTKKDVINHAIAVCTYCINICARQEHISLSSDEACIQTLNFDQPHPTLWALMQAANALVPDAKYEYLRLITPAEGKQHRKAHRMTRAIVNLQALFLHYIEIVINSFTSEPEFTEIWFVLRDFLSTVPSSAYSVMQKRLSLTYDAEVITFSNYHETIVEVQIMRDLRNAVHINGGTSKTPALASLDSDSHDNADTQSRKKQMRQYLRGVQSRLLQEYNLEERTWIDEREAEKHRLRQQHAAGIRYPKWWHWSELYFGLATDDDIKQERIRIAVVTKLRNELQTIWEARRDLCECSMRYLRQPLISSSVITIDEKVTPSEPKKQMEITVALQTAWNSLPEQTREVLLPKRKPPQNTNLEEIVTFMKQWDEKQLNQLLCERSQQLAEVVKLYLKDTRQGECRMFFRRCIAAFGEPTGEECLLPFRLERARRGFARLL